MTGTTKDANMAKGGVHLTQVSPTDWGLLVSRRCLTGWRVWNLIHSMDPTLKDYYQQLTEVSRKQQETHYSWLRYLLLLSAGTLSALVAFRSASATTHHVHLALSVALASLGLGILSGAVALYGETRVAVETTRKTGMELSRRLNNPGSPEESFVVKPPTVCIAAELACYLFLIVAVISLVIFAICN